MVGKTLKRGWFDLPGRPGDRSLAQQLQGLEILRDYLEGWNKPITVLDVGCAEGLLSMQFFDWGATAVHGIEIVPGHVEVANKMRCDRACTFEVQDANTYTPTRQYDIVVMLALLQKLRDPSAACRRFAQAARDLVVIRLPPEHAPSVFDARSGWVMHHIWDVMNEEGFHLNQAGVNGPFNEWVGYFRKRP